MNSVRHRKTVVSHPHALMIHPDFEDVREFVVSLPERFRKGEGVVIHKKRNELRRMKYAGEEFVVKSFQRPNFLNRLVYGIFRASKAQRSYEYAERFLAMGVGTPQPVGYLNIRRGGLFDESYYVSCQSECTHVYADLFHTKFDYEEEVLRAVGRITGILHEHGYAHKDYGRENILFRNTPEGIELEIVDLNRMHIGAIGVKAGCKNFMRLPATPQMHRWMAEEYAKVRGFDAEQCFDLMVAYRSTQTCEGDIY